MSELMILNEPEQYSKPVDLQFYPTPPHIIDKMLVYVKAYWGDYKSLVLDPSAGDGAILSYICDNTINGYGYRNPYFKKENCYAIELDQKRFRQVGALGFKMLGYDFLRWDGLERFDVILMNPPFKYGAEHLEKALDTLADNGHCVCLLNAETIRNPFSNQRKALLARLETMNATFEYVQAGFVDAERKTGIETVIVHVVNTVEKPKKPNPFESMQKDNTSLNAEKCKDVAPSTFSIEDLLYMYEKEKYAGLKVFEFMAKCDASFLKLNMGIEEYSKELKSKYWTKVLTIKVFAKKLASKQKETLNNQIIRMQNVEFNRSNIEMLLDSILAEATQAMQESAVALFDKFVSYASFTQGKENIYLFNGWKTNNAFKINKKIILPFGYGSPANYLDYELQKDLDDMQRILAMFSKLKPLDGSAIEDSKTRPKSWGELSEDLFRSGKQYDEWFDLDLIKVRFFKKNTIHIIFKDEDMLHRFNAYCCIEKNWLPHDYGRKAKKDMTQEELQVVESFGDYVYGETLMIE